MLFLKTLYSWITLTDKLNICFIMQTFDMKHMFYVKGLDEYCTETVCFYFHLFDLTVLNYYCNGAKGHS